MNTKKTLPQYKDEVYALDKLMAQTRRIASEYRETTGQTLPVTVELARYDCGRLLKLSAVSNTIAGVDFIGSDGSKWSGKKIQVKGRVIFNNNSSRLRLGQLNFDGAWEVIMLVLLEDNYQPRAIYALERDELLKTLAPSDINNPRGTLTINKFQALGELVWNSDLNIVT